MRLVGMDHVEPFWMDRCPHNFIAEWLCCGGCIVDGVPGGFLEENNVELILSCFQNGFS
jgi:hypothetical protein